MKRKRKQTAWILLCLCFFCLAACGKQTEADAAFYMEQGNSALMEGDLAGARASFSKAHEILPDDPGVIRAMGVLCYKEKDYPEAVIYFSKALLALGEGDAGSIREDILRYKADAEMLLKDFAEAETDYLAEAEADYGLLISLDDECAEFYLLRGKARAGLGRIDDAVGDFRTALSLSPGNPDYCEDMYLTLKEEGAAEAGLEFLNGILSAAPKDGEDKSRYGRTCLELALFRMEEGQYEEALSLIQEASDSAEEPVREELLYAEAVCYERLLDFETALSRFLSYQDVYGADQKVEHEIAFLRTRVETP